jgi:hypothetical protein
MILDEAPMGRQHSAMPFDFNHNIRISLVGSLLLPAIAAEKHTFKAEADGVKPATIVVKTH